MSHHDGTWAADCDYYITYYLSYWIFNSPALVMPQPELSLFLAIILHPSTLSDAYSGVLEIDQRYPCLSNAMIPPPFNIHGL